MLRPVHLLALTSALTSVLTCAGCSSGGGDLNNLELRPKLLGNPIAKAADPKSRIADGATIRALGVVIIAVDGYDESKDGKGVGDIFVQDPVQTGPNGTPLPKGVPWSGLRLYRPTKNPPDLELVPGQGVDLVGIFAAFAGPPGSSPFDPGVAVPQASSASLTLTYEGPAPQPIELDFADLADEPSAIQYASRLVKLRNVPILKGFIAGAKRPEAQIFSSDNSIVLSAKFFPIHETDGLNVAAGTTLKSVTGILDYFYNFKLCPRSIADIEP